MSETEMLAEILEAIREVHGAVRVMIFLSGLGVGTLISILIDRVRGK